MIRKTTERAFSLSNVDHLEKSVRVDSAITNLRSWNDVVDDEVDDWWNRVLSFQNCSNEFFMPSRSTHFHFFPFFFTWISLMYSCGFVRQKNFYLSWLTARRGRDVWQVDKVVMRLVKSTSLLISSPVLIASEKVLLNMLHIDRIDGMKLEKRTFFINKMMNFLQKFILKMLLRDRNKIFIIKFIKIILMKG